MNLTIEQILTLLSITRCTPDAVVVLQCGPDIPDGRGQYYPAIKHNDGTVRMVCYKSALYHDTREAAVDTARACIENAEEVLCRVVDGTYGGASLMVMGERLSSSTATDESDSLCDVADHADPVWSEYDQMNPPQDGKRYVIQKQSNGGLQTYINAVWVQLSRMWAIPDAYRWHYPKMDCFLEPEGWSYKPYVPEQDNRDDA